LSAIGKIEQIIAKFKEMDSWEDRYKSIIQDGKKMEPLAREFQVDKYKINGCQSQVWLVPNLSEGKVYFKADSDAFLVKGIINLLVSVYSGLNPDEILTTDAGFLKEIGITEHLSMNRSNGLASMVKQIKMYAVAFKSLTDNGVLNA
jgi:cysteine desulfuration protein SufE